MYIYIYTYKYKNNLQSNLQEKSWLTYDGVLILRTLEEALLVYRNPKSSVGPGRRQETAEGMYSSATGGAGRHCPTCLVIVLLQRGSSQRVLNAPGA